MFHSEKMKALLAEPRLILNIVEEEYNTACSTQKRKMLCGLEDKLKEFHRCTAFPEDRPLTDRPMHYLGH